VSFAVSRAALGRFFEIARVLVRLDHIAKKAT
jgi:hypothetical protein